MQESNEGPSAGLLGKVKHLLPILDELDKLAKRQGALQVRANDAAKAMLRVARNQVKAPTDKGAEELRRLSGNSQSLQASVSTAQRNAERHRRALNTGVAHLQKSVEGVEAQSSATALELDRMHRCCGALIRTVFAAMDRSVVLTGGKEGDPDDDFELPDGSYSYIPLNIVRFLDLLTATGELLSLDQDFAKPGQLYRPVRFLEVGCGTGRNVMIAQASQLLHLEACAGFDINSDQVETGRRAFGLADELSVADALTFDYSGFDVVYSYRPFENGKLQRQLEQRFAETMDTGAYLLSPLGFDLNLCPELTYIGAQGQIWKKTG